MESLQAQKWIPDGSNFGAEHTAAADTAPQQLSTSPDDAPDDTSGAAEGEPATTAEATADGAVATGNAAQDADDKSEEDTLGSEAVDGSNGSSAPERTDINSSGSTEGSPSVSVCHSSGRTSVLVK